MADYREFDKKLFDQGNPIQLRGGQAVNIHAKAAIGHPDYPIRGEYQNGYGDWTQCQWTRNGRYAVGAQGNIDVILIPLFNLNGTDYYVGDKMLIKCGQNQNRVITINATHTPAMISELTSSKTYLSGYFNEPQPNISAIISKHTPRPECTIPILELEKLYNDDAPIEDFLKAIVAAVTTNLLETQKQEVLAFLKT